MAIWDDGTGKIWIVSGGNPFDATQNTLEGCCCCAPCCEDPWTLCVEVSDGSTTGKARVVIDTTLSGCCCTGTATGNLCESDGTNIGTVQVELLVTHDGTFAQFTVTSPTFSCAGGCVSAWVEGVLTGTAPNNCKITFSLTIARNGTTPLTVSATDDFVSATCYDCASTSCPGDCSACPSQIQVVLSGFPVSTVGYHNYPSGCCWRWNYMNGTYTLTRSGCGWSWDGYNGGVDCARRFSLRIVCEDNHWRFTLYPYNSFAAWNIRFQDAKFFSCPSDGIWTYLTCTTTISDTDCPGYNCNGSVGVVTIAAV